MPGEKRGPSDQDIDKSKEKNEVATLEDIDAAAGIDINKKTVGERLKLAVERRAGVVGSEINKELPDNHIKRGIRTGQSSIRLRSSHSAQEGNSAHSAETAQVDRKETLRKILDKTEQGKKYDFKLIVDTDAGRRDMYILKLINKPETGRKPKVLKEINGSFSDIVAELHKYLGIQTRA